MTEQEKQKRIKEMADVIANVIGRELIDAFVEDDNGDLARVETMSTCAIAKRLLQAGYGDTKQAVREFAEKVQYDVLNYVLKQFKPKPDDKLTNVIYSISRKIDELVKEICDK